MVLASTPDAGNITELAQLADKVMEVATPSVSGITTTTELDQLRQEVAELKTMLKSLQIVNKKPQHGRSPSPAPQRQQMQDVCWYHAKFGEKALKCKPPCSKAGQTPAKLVATGTTSLLLNHLFFITDNNSAHRFLVDTGAKVSVMPPTRTDRKHPQEGCNLLAVNGSSIPTYEKRSLTLNLGLRRVFIVANVQAPILGADFLRHFSLLVYIKHSRLIDTTTQLRVQGMVFQTTFPSPSFLPLQPTNIFTSIIAKYPAVFQPYFNTQPAIHDVTHHIQTSEPPPVAKQDDCLLRS